MSLTLSIHFGKFSPWLKRSRQGCFWPWNFNNTVKVKYHKLTGGLTLLKFLMMCILVRFLPLSLLLFLFFNLTFILQSEALLFIILLQIFRIVVHQQAACPKSKCDIMVVLLAEIKMQFKFKILSSKPHGNGSSNISLSKVAFISAHKRNNKEDVTGRNEGIWPCRLVGVPLRGSSLSRFNVWKVKPFKNQLGSLWWSVIDFSTIGCLTKYTLHAGWGMRML